MDLGPLYQDMHNSLQLNNGNNTFSEISWMANVAETDWSWCPLIADFDNDGYKDIFVTNGIKREVFDLRLFNFHTFQRDHPSALRWEILIMMIRSPFLDHFER